MTQSSPIEAEFAPSYRQLFGELVQVQTLEMAVDCCVKLLDTYLSPQACQVVWHADRTPYALGPDRGAPIQALDADDLAQLRAGELVLRADGELVAVAYAPLRARGILLGWIAVERPSWGADSAATLAALADQAGPVLAMLEATNRRDERLAQLRTLNEIGRLLSGVLDLDQLLEAIYTATRRVVEAPMFYIAFYDELADRLQLAYVVTEGTQQPTKESWPSDVGLAGIIVRDRSPIRTEDYTEECRRRKVTPRPFEGLPEARAWLGVPLIAHDRLIGVMTINTLRPGYTYHDEHVELMTTIAAQAAVAIENARLYQRSARQARQLATLNRIGRTITSSLDPERVPALIISQVTKLLDVHEGSLLLIDDATGELVFAYTTGPIGERLLGQRLPRGTGIAGYVVANGQSVIINDVQSDGRFNPTTDQSTGFVTRTMLAVPLLGVGGVQGVIEALNRRDGGQFTIEDQQLLEAMADQAVIALENARRFAQVDQALARRAQDLVQTNDRLQHNLRSLTALNALGMAINSTLRSADEIFGMTARGVVELTGASGASVLLLEGDHFRPTIQIGPGLPLSGAINDSLRHVMRTGRPDMLAADAWPLLSQLGARTLFIVPLRATQKLLGCLCVTYADAAPDAPDQETVVLFATQAAVAVESIELFTAVRAGRDQMASILASTREGIMLITPDTHVAVANAALHQLSGLLPQATMNASIEQFLTAWERAIRYPADEWAAFRQGLDRVMSGRESFASGTLNELSASAHPRSVEWATLTALSSGDSSGGALLVLRDITEAKESERLRQDLTNMIVHDLRSPLSSVMASIDLLVRGITGELNSNQRGVLNIAYNSSTQMLEIVNTLLDISRLESGRMPLEVEQCEVRSLLDRAIERLVSLAHERNTLIQQDIAATLSHVCADRELIVRVVQNLLGNALKFSGRGSTVLIRAFAGSGGRAAERWGNGAEEQASHWPAAPDDGGFVTVAISDRGVGIAPQDQEKIFTKFGQVGERRGGSGLGLTFCKLVVEAHGGRIWVESQPGEGSTFFFTLPTTTEL